MSRSLSVGPCSFTNKLLSADEILKKKYFLVSDSHLLFTQCPVIRRVIMAMPSNEG